MQISTTTAIDRKIPNTLLSLCSVLIFDLAVFTGDCIRLHRDNHALNRYFIDFRKDRPIEAVNELQVRPPRWQTSRHRERQQRAARRRYWQRQPWCVARTI